MSRLVSIVAFCAFVISTNENEAARILVVIPTPSISHQVPIRPLTQDLARRGHDVVVITTDPAFPEGQAPGNLTEIDSHDKSYEMWRKARTIIKDGDKNEIKQHLEVRIKMSVEVFEEQTKDPRVRDIIEKQSATFDLLIVEAWMRFLVGFSYAVNKPVIAISSFSAFLTYYDVIGAPAHPFLYPVVVNTRLYNLSFLEKITQFYHWFSMMRFYEQSLADNENAALRRIFGENIPTVSELQNNVNMLILNNHFIWEGNRPVPPGVVYMGGVHQTPPKELPKDLKSYLDSSVNGVIYFSFGTNVEPSVLPSEKIQAIIKVFSLLPYDVLWKWNQGDLPGLSKNVKTFKWLPQSDLLRHPKIKLFITQGGLQSTDEAITAGVPLLGIPMRTDQFYNVENYVHFKIGMRLELSDLEVESLKNAIETVIADKSYRENIVHLRTLMEDQPMPPLERAVWWTEHLLRHGGAHLRAPAANMSWAQYYEIDLILTVLGVVIVLIVFNSLVIYAVVKFVRRFLFSAKVKKM